MEHPYQRVTRALREDLKSAQVGERLPTQDALERRFGVARMTIKKAIDELEAEGLIVRGRGAAARVVRVPTEPPAVTLESIAQRLETIEAKLDRLLKSSEND